MRKALLPLLLCAALLCACGADSAPVPAEGEMACHLYFAADQTVFRPSVVQSELRLLPASPPAVESLMAALLSGPRSEGLLSPFPRGLSLRSWRQEGDTLRLDLSEPYGSLSGIELTIADACLALTLCQIEGVEAVTITSNGRPILFRDRQLLRGSDLLLSPGQEDPYYLRVALYYPRKDAPLLGEEGRELFVSPGQSLLRPVLSALLAPPSDPAHRSPFPEGLVLVDAALDGGLCRVNFSGALWDADHTGGALLLYSVVNTLCALDGVDRVQLLIDGDAPAFFGGIPARFPLEADASYLGQTD